MGLSVCLCAAVLRLHGVAPATHRVGYRVDACIGRVCPGRGRGTGQAGPVGTRPRGLEHQPVEMGM
jgi:hypothetical protein